AGEVSGDVVAARVAAELRRRLPTAGLFGLGGDRMAAAGVDLVAVTSHLGSVGITEGIGVTRELLRAWRRLGARTRADRPDVALLIGNDVFHVVVRRRLRRLGIPVISLSPPQVWVWRSLGWFIGGSFDLILASFPEEERVYRWSCG